MRLYAFLVLPLFAHAVRAAAIPDNTQGDQERLQKSQDDFIAQITDGAAEQNSEEPSSDAAPVIPETRTQTFITTFQNDVQNGSADITNSISNIVIGDPNTEVDVASASAETLVPPEPESVDAAAPPQSGSVDAAAPPQSGSVEAAVPPQCASVEPSTPSQPAGAQADNPPSQGGGFSYQQLVDLQKIINQVIQQFTQNTYVNNSIEKVQNNVSQFTQNFNPQTFLGGAGGTGGSGAPGGAGGAGASTGGAGGSSLPGR